VLAHTPQLCQLIVVTIRCQLTGASCDRNASDEIIPAMFCSPDTRPRVVALPLTDVVLLDNHAGTRTAGVKDPKVRRNVL
jgi:hypothetical protein